MTEIEEKIGNAIKAAKAAYLAEVNQAKDAAPEVIGAALSEN